MSQANAVLTGVEGRLHCPQCWEPLYVRAVVICTGIPAFANADGTPGYTFQTFEVDEAEHTHCDYATLYCPDCGDLEANDADAD